MPMLYTIKEAAGELRLSERTVAKLVASGELRSMTIGRSRRISAEALHAYVATRDCVQASEPVEVRGRRWIRVVQ